MNIGFALITAPPFFNKFVEIENELHAECNFHNELGEINNIPHTTIFQGSFSEGTDYIMISEKIAKKYREISTQMQLSFNQVLYVPDGWYFYMCEKNEILQTLHDYTLELCVNNIVLDENRLKRDLSKLPENQKEGILKYGYRYSGSAFSPHITIGRTNETEANSNTINLLSNNLNKLSKTVPVKRITVYKMGTDGMHAETLHEIIL